MSWSQTLPDRCIILKAVSSFYFQNGNSMQIYHFSSQTEWTNLKGVLPSIANVL